MDRNIMKELKSYKAMINNALYYLSSDSSSPGKCCYDCSSCSKIKKECADEVKIIGSEHVGQELFESMCRKCYKKQQRQVSVEIEGECYNFGTYPIGVSRYISLLHVLSNDVKYITFAFHYSVLSDNFCNRFVTVPIGMRTPAQALSDEIIETDYDFHYTFKIITSIIKLKRDFIKMICFGRYCLFDVDKKTLMIDSTLLDKNTNNIFLNLNQKMETLTNIFKLYPSTNRNNIRTSLFMLFPILKFLAISVIPDSVDTIDKVLTKEAVSDLMSKNFESSLGQFKIIETSSVDDGDKLSRRLSLVSYRTDFGIAVYAEMLSLLYNTKMSSFLMRMKTDEVDDILIFLSPTPSYVLHKLLLDIKQISRVSSFIKGNVDQEYKVHLLMKRHKLLFSICDNILNSIKYLDLLYKNGHKSIKKVWKREQENNHLWIEKNKVLIANFLLETQARELLLKFDYNIDTTFKNNMKQFDNEDNISSNARIDKSEARYETLHNILFTKINKIVFKIIKFLNIRTKLLGVDDLLSLQRSGEKKQVFYYHHKIHDLPSTYQNDFAIASQLQLTLYGKDENTQNTKIYGKETMLPNHNIPMPLFINIKNISEMFRLPYSTTVSSYAHSLYTILYTLTYVPIEDVDITTTFSSIYNDFRNTDNTVHKNSVRRLSRQSIKIIRLLLERAIKIHFRKFRGVEIHFSNDPKNSAKLNHIVSYEIFKKSTVEMSDSNNLDEKMEINILEPLNDKIESILKVFAPTDDVLKFKECEEKGKHEDSRGFNIDERQTSRGIPMVPVRTYNDDVSDCLPDIRLGTMEMGEFVDVDGTDKVDGLVQMKKIINVTLSMLSIGKYNDINNTRTELKGTRCRLLEVANNNFSMLELNLSSLTNSKLLKLSTIFYASLTEMFKNNMTEEEIEFVKDIKAPYMIKLIIQFVIDVVFEILLYHYNVDNYLPAIYSSMCSFVKSTELSSKIPINTIMEQDKSNSMLGDNYNNVVLLCSLLSNLNHTMYRCTTIMEKKETNPCTIKTVDHDKILSNTLNVLNRLTASLMIRTSNVLLMSIAENSRNKQGRVENSHKMIDTIKKVQLSNLNLSLARMSSVLATMPDQEAGSEPASLGIEQTEGWLELYSLLSDILVQTVMHRDAGGRAGEDAPLLGRSASLLSRAAVGAGGRDRPPGRPAQALLRALRESF